MKINEWLKNTFIESGSSNLYDPDMLGEREFTHVKLGTSCGDGGLRNYCGGQVVITFTFRDNGLQHEYPVSLDTREKVTRLRLSQAR